MSLCSAQSVAMASADETRAVEPFPTFCAPIERTESEYECELMIEALTKELTAVKNQLAFLTHHLDRQCQSQKLPNVHDRSNGQSSYLPPATSTRSFGLPSRAPALETYPDLQAAAIGNTVTTRKSHVKKIKPGKKNAGDIEGMMTEGEVKELNRHYLTVVDRVEKERWEARKRCLTLMQAHIEQQLQTLQERAERFKKKLDRIKRKERAERLKLKPPRFKSSGIDDTSFLARVPQSTFYKIVGLEHELKTEGKLRTLTDVKEFWEHMLAPTRESTATQPSTLHRPPSTPFTVMEEEEEEEEEGYSDSWAITALPPHSSTYSSRRSPMRMRTATPITPSTPDSLRFIPMKIPHFKSVDEILGEEKPSCSAAECESDCNLRVKELEVERRKLHHMYQQARTHEMVMQRLLPEMPRFKTHPIFAKESEVVDSKGEEEEEQDHSHDKLEHSYGTPLIPQQPLVDPTVEPEVDHSITNSLLSRDSDHEVLDEEKPLTTETSGMLEFQGPAPCMADGLHKPVLIPLTMDTAMNSFPVRESKCKSALWTNYLMAKGCS